MPPTDRSTKVPYRPDCTGSAGRLSPLLNGQRIGLLLLPGFSWMTFSSMIEPMRQANRLLGRRAYYWRLFSCDGAPVEASSGDNLIVDGDLKGEDRFDYVFVCAGIETETAHDARAFPWLRRLAAHGTAVGAVSTGAFLLARAGLLDGYRCTVHWESFESLREAFPDLNLTTNLFEIDRQRITCAGATACIDLMLHLIGDQFGHGLAAAVSDQFNHGEIRESLTAQRMPTNIRLRTSHPKLVAAIKLMEAEVEEPYGLAELARIVRVSPRQLERVFKQHLGVSVIRYYKTLRLQRANLLLTQTHLPVTEIAGACGFRSAAQFSRDYRKLFGQTPISERVSQHTARLEHHAISAASNG